MRAGQHPLYFLNFLLFIFCIGLYGASVFSLSLKWIAFLLSLLSGAAFWGIWHQNRRWSIFCLAFFCLLLGAGRFLLANQISDQDVSHYVHQEVLLTGTLQEAPRCMEDAEGGEKLRYLVTAEGMQLVGQASAPVQGRVYVYAYHKEKMAEKVQIGDRISVRGVLKELHGYGNPGRIDTVRAAKARGITARISAEKGGIKIEPQEKLLYLRKSEAIRQHYAGLMEQAMSPEDAAAVFAMLFGGYDGIRPALVEAFTATGIVHILSVSGSHISLLAATLAWLGRVLRLRRGLVAIGVAVVILLYTVLAGCVPPVLRAAAMGLVSFWALVWERERDARYILTLTAFVMLLVSPLQFFDISFQLSFAATAGLLYFAPGLREAFSRLPDWMAGSLAITTGAQLASLPFLAWYFHCISLSALLANLLVVPVLENLIVLGLAAGVLGFLFPLAGRFIFVVDSLLLGIAYESASALQLIPGGQLYLPTMGLPGGILYFLLCWFFFQPREKCQRLWQWIRNWGWKVPVGCMLAGAALGGFWLTRPLEMAVHFVDVGQGDAALVVTPHGQAFMVDTGGTRDGTFDLGSRVDVPYLLHYGVRQLNYIFLTHAHEDHAAGTAGILRHIPVGHVLGGNESLAVYAKAMKLSYAAPELKKISAAESGDHWELDGVRIDVLYAPQPSADGRQTGNEVSNVLRVSYGQASFLFTGDLVKEQEREILQQGISVQSTVLKVGHHGSKTSTTPDFLTAVAPLYAVISVGSDNTFGHPHRVTLECLQRAGVRICRTDEQGAIVFHTDGKYLRQESFYKDAGQDKF